MPRISLAPAMFFSLALFCMTCTGARPQIAPLHPGGQGSLDARGCPSRPNCVSSFAPRDSDHYIQPIAIPDGMPAPLASVRLLNIVRAMPRAYIVRLEAGYVHAEFRSRIFRFGDDLELLLDEKARVIQVRSAARLGYSDLGVNRRRVEEVRRRFLRQP